MKVKALIAALSKVNPEARVFHGYDSNFVLTEPDSVETIEHEDEIRVCWHRAEVGDVVILEA